MQAIQESLIASINRMKAELQLYTVLNEALTARYADDLAALQEYDRRARRTTYSATIVSCYGLIEQTIDSVLIATAEAIGRIYSRHDELPAAVRKNHRDLLLACLRDGESARTRAKVGERAALQALGREPGESAQLLAEVFTLSTANYRLPYVQLLFNRLGVDVSAGLPLNEPTDELLKVGFANYESFVADLVQRRNELAHSYGDDNLIDPELLSAYVEIVSSYLRSVDRVAHLANVQLLSDKRLLSIGTVVASWTGRIGIRLTNGSLKLGDQLLILKDDWTTSHSVISLQTEGHSLEEAVHAGIDLDISAQVSSVPSNVENAKAYVIPTEWIDLWPAANKC